MVRKPDPEKRTQFLDAALKLFTRNDVQQTSTAGGLVNASQAVRGAVKTVHHILPYLAVLSTAGSMYLLVSHRL